MIFMYNNILLEKVNLVSYEKTPVWDGPTYLYTRHTIHVTAVYNPGATSYRKSGADLIRTDTLSPNPAMAAETEAAIQHYLSVPRKKLIVAVGPNVLVESPPTRTATTSQPTDANNGPMPLKCVVKEMRGIKTFTVEYIIQTDLPGTDYPGLVPSAMLSHRWRMVHDIGQNLYTTRTIQGHAIFRTDFLLRNNITPDDFRQTFLHPIPPSFQRERVLVQATEDGTAIHYTVVDREKKSTITDAFRLFGVTRVAAVERIDVASGTLTRAIGQAFGEGFGAFKQQLSFPNAVNAPGINIRPNVKTGGFAGGVIAALSALPSAYQNLTPKIVITWNVAMEGSRRAQPHLMRELCLDVVHTRVNAFNFAFGGAGMEAMGQLTTDLVENIVELNFSYERGLLSGRLGGLAQGGFTNSFPRLRKLISENNPVVRNLIRANVILAGGGNAIAAGAPGFGITLRDATVPGPGPPSDANSRGSYIERCVAQALIDSYTRSRVNRLTKVDNSEQRSPVTDFS